MYFPKNRSVRIRLKRYLDEQTGHKVQNLWTDISPINSQATERLGYPTQKPRALLERIIRASSNEGSVALEPFRGCGTTIDAARRLNRRWAGIDISSLAIDLIRDKRLRDPTIAVRGIPTDVASARKLARDKPFDFESWAVTRLPGFAPNMKRLGDGGVDGRGMLATRPDGWKSRLALAQVKGGKFSLSTLRDFIQVSDRGKAALGCYITLDPVKTKAARIEVANAGKISVSGYPYPRMQLSPICEYFDQRLPTLPVMNDPYSGKPIVQGTLFQQAGHSSQVARSARQAQEPARAADRPADRPLVPAVQGRARGRPVSRRDVRGDRQGGHADRECGVLPSAEAPPAGSLRESDRPAGGVFGHPFITIPKKTRGR